MEELGFHMFRIDLGRSGTMRPGFGISTKAGECLGQFPMEEGIAGAEGERVLQIGDSSLEPALGEAETPKGRQFLGPVNPVSQRQLVMFPRLVCPAPLFKKLTDA